MVTNECAKTIGQRDQTTLISSKLAKNSILSTLEVIFALHTLISVAQLDSLLVNPLKAVVGQTADNLLSTVDGVMDGLNRVLQMSGVRPLSREDTQDSDPCKVGASLDIEVIYVLKIFSSIITI